MGPCFRWDDVTLLDDQSAQIVPIEIFLLDKRNLPVTLPPFELLLSLNRFVRTCKRFDMNQPGNAILLHKL